MAVGEIYAFQVQTEIQARKTTNNLGYRQVIGDAVNNIPFLINEAWNDDIRPAYLDVLSSDATYNCTYCSGLLPGQTVPDERAAGDQNGNRSPNAQPNDNTLNFNLTTDSNSSKDNGIIFISGVSDADVTPLGDLDTVFLNTQVLALAIALQAPLAAPLGNNQVWELVVIDRVFSGIPLTPPTAHTVVDITPKSFFLTQSRRRTRETKIGIIPS